jgi:hypothetical protein
MSEPDYPLDGFTVPSLQPAQAAAARPWTIGLATVFAVVQVVLLLAAALLCFGVFFVWNDRGGASADVRRTAADLWPLLALGVANVLLATGFGVLSRLTLARGRLWLAVCAVVNTALAGVWLAANRAPILLGWEIAYLMIPIVALTLALHPRTTAYLRAHPAPKRR